MKFDELSEKAQQYLIEKASRVYSDILYEEINQDVETIRDRVYDYGFAITSMEYDTDKRYFYCYMHYENHNSSYKKVKKDYKNVTKNKDIVEIVQKLVNLNKPYFYQLYADTWTTNRGMGISVSKMDYVPCKELTKEIEDDVKDLIQQFCNWFLQEIINLEEFYFSRDNLIETAGYQDCYEFEEDEFGSVTETLV